MLLDFLMPAKCAGCATPGSAFCPACEAAIATAPGLWLPAGDGLPPITALGPHEGRLRCAVLALKFRGARALGARLGRMLGDKILAPFDVLVPVPLHPARLRERGYDQAAAIAGGIARACGATSLEDAIRRTRATPPQSRLDLQQRRRNVDGAFTLGPRAAKLRQMRVVLVDDVVTTGATIRACAQVLLEAGARSVSVACAALRL